MKTARTLLLTLSVLLLVSSAHAQSDADKMTARNLFHEGEAALKTKDCAKAADRFERAGQLYKAPTIMLGLARAYVYSKRAAPPRPSAARPLSHPRRRRPPR